ncbi:MAG: IS66 family transposase [Terriglobales bacterium]
MDGDPRAIARMHQEHAHWLQVENNTLHRDLSAKLVETLALRKENAALREENGKLKKRIAELTAASSAASASDSTGPPAFLKPNTPQKARRRPGRPAGHEAALRPRPRKIDVHLDVPLPVDRRKQGCCPACRTQLSDVKSHRRWVEDIVPSKVITTCYRTQSGYCPSCRKRVESRADDQPPAADLGHAQLGLEAMATAAVMRVCYRLPLRQISQLFADLPGLSVSPGAISKQIQRLGRWLEGYYDQLQLVLRAAGVVHADETGWRIDGKNGYLWTLTNADHTLYHVDRSRGGKVIAKLLGEAFGGTLVSDFYAVYDQFDCPQQKCLTHLLRELREVVVKRPELAQHGFFRACKSLLQAMLRLKKQRRKLLAAQYHARVKGLETRLANLGRKTWDQADADRLAARLRKYGKRLTTFLHDPQVDGTNNAAERALRPAVVMRKITGGNRSEAGARAWAILASVMRTAQQQGRDVLDTLKALLRAAWAGTTVAMLTDSS